MTDNLTAELARLNALDAKRTPGQWHAYRGSKYLEIGSDFDGGRTIICTDYSFIDDQDEMDATLLAAAPDAVALANKLHALLVQAEKDRDYWKEKADDYGKKWLDMTQEYNEVLALAEQAEGALQTSISVINTPYNFSDSERRFTFGVMKKALTALRGAGIGGSDGK